MLVMGKKLIRRERMQTLKVYVVGLGPHLMALAHCVVLAALLYAS